MTHGVRYCDFFSDRAKIRRALLRDRLRRLRPGECLPGVGPRQPDCSPGPSSEGMRHQTGTVYLDNNHVFIISFFVTQWFERPRVQVLSNKQLSKSTLVTVRCYDPFGEGNLEDINKIPKSSILEAVSKIIVML